VAGPASFLSCSVDTDGSNLPGCLYKIKGGEKREEKKKKRGRVKARDLYIYFVNLSSWDDEPARRKGKRRKQRDSTFFLMVSLILKRRGEKCLSVFCVAKKKEGERGLLCSPSSVEREGPRKRKKAGAWANAACWWWSWAPSSTSHCTLCVSVWGGEKLPKMGGSASNGIWGDREDAQLLLVKQVKLCGMRARFAGESFSPSSPHLYHFAWVLGEGEEEGPYSFPCFSKFSHSVLNA